jgi:hypothetical protein
MAALLAGDGDPSRYLAPGAVLAPVTPVPFTEVSVTGQAIAPASDGGSRVRVEIRAVTSAHQTWTLSYELMAVERVGRWEIRSLSAAPTLSEEASSAAAPSASTSTSTAAQPGA